MAYRNERRQILGLDLIRFAAAFMVFSFHLGLYQSGWVGVEIFFVISGYVIANSASNSTARQFFRSRVVRLMPAVWICGTGTAIVVAIAGLYRGSDLAVRYLATLVLWPSGPWLDGAYWTLPIEVAFYSLIGVANWRRLPLTRVIGGIAIVSALFWTIRVGLQFRPNLPMLGIINLIPNTAANLTMLTMGCYFAVGALLWAMMEYRRTAWKLTLLAASLGAGAVQIVFAASSWTHAKSGTTASHWQHIEPVLVWLVAVGAIAASTAFNGVAWHFAGRYARQIRFIGLMTYPLYLIHDNIGLLMLRYAVPLVVMIAMISLAAVLAAFVEPPTQTWLRNRLRFLS
jgi:exopolysaccharide production protein ExoZ